MSKRLADRVTESLNSFADAVKNDEPISVTTFSKRTSVGPPHDLIGRKPLAARVKWDWNKIEHAGIKAGVYREFDKWYVSGTLVERTLLPDADCLVAAQSQALAVIQAAVLSAAAAWAD